MRTQHLVAAAVVSLSCVLGVASCVRGPEPSSETEGEGAPGGAEPVGGNVIDEASEAVNVPIRIQCPKQDSGMHCVQRCAEAGISCAPTLPHPQRTDGGTGELFECRGLAVVKSCWYDYPAIQEKCVRLTGGYTLCSAKAGDDPRALGGG